MVAQAGEAPSLVESIGYPAAVMGTIGLLLGAGLAFASRKLAVKKDPLVEKVDGLLPGANCGGCGYPGCSAFAEAVVAGDAPPDGCVAASPEINAAIAEAVGAEGSGGGVRKTAVVQCNGGFSARDVFDYRGPRSCSSATIVMGGAKGCSFGCLGFGDCVAACPFGAIRMGEDGVPEVDSEACTGCGLCVAACPKKLITLWPVTKQVVVACSNRDKGVVARKQCSVACIGCRKCEKACPYDAITVEGFLSRIDPEKCENCGICARVCPTGSIVDRATARPKAYIVEADCVGCTLCARACPVNAISGELKEVHTVDQDACIGCGLCVARCPKSAIRLLGALGASRREDRAAGG